MSLIYRFKVAVVLVAHILRGNDTFVEAIADVARIAAIIPKPSSIDEHELSKLSQKGYPIMRLSREKCSDTDFLAAKLNEVIKPNERVILLDVGGYFAFLLRPFSARTGRFSMIKRLWSLDMEKSAKASLMLSPREK